MQDIKAIERVEIEHVGGNMSGGAAAAQKRAQPKRKSTVTVTVTDTVPRSYNVTVCHCVGDVWALGPSLGQLNIFLGVKW